MLPATGAALGLPPPTSVPGKPPDAPPDRVTAPRIPGIIAAPQLIVPSGPLPVALSPCGNDQDTSGTSLPPGQVSPVEPSDLPLPDDMDGMSETSNSVSETVVYANEAMASTEKSDLPQHVLPPKRRRDSKRSYRPLDISTVPSPLRHGVVVVIKPDDTSKIITRFNPLVIKGGTRIFGSRWCTASTTKS
ncbi:hypothetical protein HPB48_021536 [Haemaphysalis longicornis]|uniref:Uncharacterized protein n=1 Tax=Haemaphysalis longicornis TaxID=44386 RepID=A0A9J6GC58_HAELO|nr:hypothetical protein HPB48_021536 [Haemaphysalis longicornis]